MPESAIPALFHRMALHGGRPAIVQPGAPSLSHWEVLARAHGLAHSLAECDGESVAFMARPGEVYLAAMLGIWASGRIAVPLPPSYPEQELAHIIATTQPGLVLIEPEFGCRLDSLATTHSVKLRALQPVPGPPFSVQAASSSSTAMILFTSGTTSRPKGVAITHANLEAQMDLLCRAWRWTSSDRILHTLPLHHVHGITNAMLCAMWAGASIQFLPRFDAGQVWEALMDPAVTVFMGVPTMYARLLDDVEGSVEPLRGRMQERMREMRLWVSGSAALPASLQARWQALSGRYLLERYGMTEIGMALGIPYGEGRPGSVGVPFETVEVMVVDEAGVPVAAGEAGELWVKGPSVFAGYWGLAEATSAAFRDGWFMTGDVVQQDADGWYRILGRRSADIIKCGGYKLSALEIEEVFREHPDVRDCAVLGLADAEWGEVVAMAVAGDAGLDKEGLLAWAKGRMAAYKLPRRVVLMAELPRNAMGKVVKAQLRGSFQ